MEAKKREPLNSLLLYYLFKWSIIAPTFNTYFRGRIYGLEKIPQTGPGIIVSNHASYFDPPILGAAMGRPVAFMAKEELFEIPVLKEGIRLYGAYPVKRASADRSAIKAATEMLKQGWLAGLFLEGTRTPDGRIHEPKLGAALIAAKNQVPLIPVCLWGTEKILVKGKKFPQPVPLTVRIGDLIPPPSSTKKEELLAVTEKCTTVINSLHDLGR
jgi:1-acyl-sn-glycerol-3-phosphate acyltransferase